MTVAEVRRLCAEHRVELWVEGGRLRYRAPRGALDPAVREELARNKAALISELRTEQDAPCPLSINQQSLWFVHQLAPSLPAYNVAVACTVAGLLDVGALRASLGELLQRHPVLRARYGMDRDAGGVGYWQPIHATDDPLEHQDATGLTDEALLQGVQEAYRRPFDLAQGRVFRAALLSRSASVHVLLLCAHHVCCDARSWGVILEDLGELYGSAIQDRQPSFGTDPGFYRRFVAEQQAVVEGQAGISHLAFWRAKLSGISTRPLLDGGVPRPEAWAFRGSTLTASVPASVAAALRALAAANGVPLFPVLLAAFQIALWRVSGREDVVVGVPMGGRLRPSDRDTVGYFVNPVAIRQRVDPTSTLAEHVERVAGTVRESLDHQEYPFAVLVERLNYQRDASRHPVFDVMFNYLNRQAAGLVVDLSCPRRSLDPLTLGPLDVLPYPVAQQEGQYDLTLEVLDNGEDLSCSARYGEPCCGVAMATSVAAAWQTVLGRIVGNQACRIAELRQAAPSTIVIASTFVADPVQPTVEYWLSRLGLAAQVQFAPYNQVFQQLVDRDGLFRQATSGLNVVLLKVDDWAADPASSPDGRRQAIRAAAGDFLRWVRAFVPESRVPLLVILCPSSDAGEPWHGEVEDGLSLELRGVAGVEVLSHAELVPAYGVETVRQPTADAVAHVPYTEEMYAALGTAIVRALHRRRGRPTKVIVVDGDETLWGGVVGESGVAGLRIDARHAALQRWLLKRHSAGMLLCLCSKNEEGDVEEVLRARADMVLRREHFSVLSAGWGAKSDRIREIGRSLNLGLDSFLFIDDSPLECAEVASRCPEVVTVRFPGSLEEVTLLLRNLWSCDAGVKTGEDERRALFYRSESTREQLKKRSTSYREFIDSLDLRIRIASASAAELPRLAQLTVRTTQFNLRSIRSTEQELSRLLDSPAYGLWSVHVKDRFGDYGLVGFLSVTWCPDAAEVDAFLLSCRALGRGVEHAVLSFLGEQASRRRISTVVLRCVTTSRNAPMRAFLASVAEAFRVPEEVEPVYRMPADAAGSCTFNPDVAATAPTPEPEGAEPAAASSVWAVPTGILAEIAESLNTARRVLDAVGRWTSGARASDSARAWSPGSGAKTEVERRIAEVWADVLKVESVPADVSFFDLGGKSILLPFVVAYLQDRHSISVALVDLFTHPTVRRLASFVSSQGSGGQSPGQTALEQETADRRSAARRRQGVLRGAARRGGEKT